MVSETKSINFLGEPSRERIRREIRNICNSYVHYWDVLAELCQNSVDAIMLYNKAYGKKHPKKHYIKITINQKERSIRVKDSGIGIPPEKLMEFLAPYGTDKDGDRDLIGEKGVGLTYTIFVSNYFEIKSKSINSFIKGHIKNAALWKNRRTDDLPKFVVDRSEKRKFYPSETSTEIYIKDIENHNECLDLFDITINTLEWLLRTQTAIGWLKGIFENRPLNIDVTLTVIDQDGERITRKIPPKYMLPEEFVDKKQVIELDKFEKLFKESHEQILNKLGVKKGVMEVFERYVLLKEYAERRRIRGK